jgi:predicted AlkP superfamily pyrophosphatase or phosphodiesterase
MTAAPLCLISVDGLCASALGERVLSLPALRGLAARGATSAGLTPSFPSVTWPCHTTLVTGARPARHGILGNQVFDRRERRPVSHYGDRSGMRPRVETLYEAAAAAGRTTAAVCWPQTRGAGCLRDNVPEFYEQELFETYASRPLWDELCAAGLPVDRYGEWSARHALGPLQDWLTLEIARHILRRRPPDVMLVHFLVVDSFQHDHGVDSPEARWALEYVDRLIGSLVDELAAVGRLEQTNVVVVGDHGFAPVDRRTLPNVVLHAEGLLDLDRQGAMVDHRVWVAANGGSAHVYVAPGPQRGALVARVRERFAGAEGVGLVLGAESFGDLGLPRPEDDPTQGDLILVAAEGWYFGEHATEDAAAVAPSYRGMHGHLPEDPRLRAGFVAAGPGIGEGIALPGLDHLDVAPTLAALLDVKLAAAERGPVEALLRR